MDIEKASFKCYTNAKENAESVFNRELTKDECMILILGLEYGKSEGYGEGRSDAGKEMKETLLRWREEFKK